MKILMCYFSATGNTRAVADVITERLSRLGAQVDQLDVTDPAFRRDLPDFSMYQGAVFGAPIHYARAPRLVREWLAGLDGRGCKAAMFFTYGGFQVHPTHYTTGQILEKQGFLVAASAEFPSRHSYNVVGWESLADRPDDSDFETARRYGEIIWARFNGEDQGMVKDLEQGALTEEQLDKMEQNRVLVLAERQPGRTAPDCQMCLLCEELCPTGAMDAERGSADPELCMVCMRCLQVCPDQVIEFLDLGAIFQWKMQNDGETQETLSAKKSKMYL